MAEKKKKTFRKEYLNDFQKDFKGNYIYTGQHMIYDGDDSSWRKDNLIFWICCLIPAILIICVGIIPGSGLIGNPLMLAPFALSFIALFIIVWKMVRFTYAGVRMRKYVYEQTVKVIPVYAIIAAGIAALAVIGMIISICLGYFNGMAYAAVIYGVSECALAAGGIALNRLFVKMTWKSE